MEHNLGAQYQIAFKIPDILYSNHSSPNPQHRGKNPTRGNRRSDLTHWVRFLHI